MKTRPSPEKRRKIFFCFFFGDVQLQKRSFYVSIVPRRHLRVKMFKYTAPGTACTNIIWISDSIDASYNYCRYRTRGGFKGGEGDTTWDEMDITFMFTVVASRSYVRMTDENIIDRFFLFFFHHAVDSPVRSFEKSKKQNLISS